MEVVPGSGFLRTKEPVITSGQLHMEWATPAKVKGEGQGRGNSGVFIGGFPEVQVLDSYDNVTYPGRPGGGALQEEHSARQRVAQTGRVAVL